MKHAKELEKSAEIEMEKLGVAENLGWWASCFAAYATYLKWDSWWLALAVMLGVYFVITLPYRKREKIAEDEYHKACGLGKYYSPKENKDE
jgi:hypothetical protein